MAIDKLIDADGENRAVRAFLLGLQINCISVPSMKSHMKDCGWPHWPDWVENDQGYLTKMGQQLWLKHLFDLVPNKWQQAMDDEMVSCHLGVVKPDDDPRAVLNKLIAWNVQVALDPAVSEDARLLVERGKQEARHGQPV